MAATLRTPRFSQQALKSSGGFVWACKNYDGDVQSDIVAQVGVALERLYACVWPRMQSVCTCALAELNYCAL
mgnify:CR=1 FL=1